MSVLESTLLASIIQQAGAYAVSMQGFGESGVLGKKRSPVIPSPVPSSLGFSHTLSWFSPCFCSCSFASFVDLSISAWPLNIEFSNAQLKACSSLCMLSHHERLSKPMASMSIYAWVDDSQVCNSYSEFFCATTDLISNSLPNISSQMSQKLLALIMSKTKQWTSPPSIQVPANLKLRSCFCHIFHLSAISLVLFSVGKNKEEKKETWK